MTKLEEKEIEKNEKKQEKQVKTGNALPGFMSTIPLAHIERAEAANNH